MNIPSQLINAADAVNPAHIFASKELDQDAAEIKSWSVVSHVLSGLSHMATGSKQCSSRTAASVPQKKILALPLVCADSRSKATSGLQNLSLNFPDVNEWN